MCVAPGHPKSQVDFVVISSDLQSNVLDTWVRRRAKPVRSSLAISSKTSTIFQGKLGVASPNGTFSAFRLLGWLHEAAAARDSVLSWW